MKIPEKLEVEAIQNGTVIDHLPSDRTLLAVEQLTDGHDHILIGLNLPSSSMGTKGILKFEDKILNTEELAVLAALAPSATVNEIANYKIVNKFKMEQPEEVRGLFVCANQNCITNHDPVTTRFKNLPDAFLCLYCERVFPVQRLKVKS
ncbi:MAG: aspartate carbamoyltransferase regulatory subunit, partial [Planctomycetes bacterium]|nr:aspartate carbamoyltransferase regulatory subunit [Planctomycetota bacterium]